MAHWTLLTNHGQVLLSITRDPNHTARQIAQEVGITERATQSIIADLEQDGYLTRHRVGRRNVYDLHLDRPLRHPAQAGHTVGEIVTPLAGTRRRGKAPAHVTHLPGADAGPAQELTQVTV